MDTGDTKIIRLREIMARTTIIGQQVIVFNQGQRESNSDYGFDAIGAQIDALQVEREALKSEAQALGYRDWPTL